MGSSQELVASLVKKVLDELTHASDGNHHADGGDGLFDTVDAAVEAAVAAQKKLIQMSLERRKDIIASIRKAVLANNERLATLAVSETKLGRVEDKIRENILCATKTPGVEDIQRGLRTDLAGVCSSWRDRRVNPDHQSHRNAYQ
jgi:propionaldehyde dehydrogenase